MLIPKRVKFRRQHRPNRSGMSKGGNRVTFGDYGLQALEPTYITNRQIEAARIAINRHIKRGGKVWINIFPDRPLTQKPLGVRMGSGKGPVEKWVANVKPGRILFEMSYPDEATALEALPPRRREAAMQGAHREEGGSVLMATGIPASELRELSNEELTTRLKESKEELFNLRFQMATGQLTNNRRLGVVKKDIARIYTVLRERELGLSTNPGGDAA